MRRVFKNARLILGPDEGIRRGWLLVEGEIIKEVSCCMEAGQFPGGVDEVIDCAGDYLSPGLIDLHCHGAMGRDTMEATPDAFTAILNYHAMRGTTLSVLTTVAASLEDIKRVLSTAEAYLPGRDQARLAGIHLEGPYFSPFRRGAHRQEMLRHPTAGETREILSHASVIKRMTLAPEIAGILDLVTELVGKGIAVSAGHSEATEGEAATGFAVGITQVTHLYNCMSSLRSSGGRRFAGLTEAALTTPGILCEVIADGRHLPPTLLRLAWLAKGWEETAIVSDATAGAGLDEGVSFELGGVPCYIEAGGAWTGHGEDRRLAGSTIGMIDGVRTMMELAGIPLDQAVAMATLVPARALGLEKATGSLAGGKRADLLRFSDGWEVQGVWIAGEKLKS